MIIELASGEQRRLPKGSAAMSGSRIRKAGKHRKPRPSILRLLRHRLSRRGGPLAVTATVTAIAIFGATQAVAAPQPPGPPPAGSQHTLQAKAEGVRLTVRGDTIVRDFRGKLKVRVTGADKRAPWHLTFTIVKINITSSANGPYGRLKLKTKLEASTKNSTLRTTQLHPLRWKSDVYLDFTLKAGKQRQQPPGTERQALHVSTAAAGEFTGSGKAFPPKNGHYTLKKPIKLAKANGNGKVLVKINKFPLELSS